jgi:tRNA U55 pseudouridine synthase TruB
LVSEAVTLEQLGTALADDGVEQYLYPLDAALSHLPALRLGYDEARRLAMGQAIAADWPESVHARAYAPGGRFVALVVRKDEQDETWRPHKVFAKPEEIGPPQA